VGRKTVASSGGPTWVGWSKGFAGAFVRPRDYQIVVVSDVNRLGTPFAIAYMAGVATQRFTVVI
jgi:hypothetical protein